MNKAQAHQSMTARAKLARVEQQVALQLLRLDRINSLIGHWMAARAIGEEKLGKLVEKRNRLGRMMVAEEETAAGGGK